MSTPTPEEIAAATAIIEAAAVSEGKTPEQIVATVVDAESASAEPVSSDILLGPTNVGV